MASPGLRFKKIDLHVHTPASGDFLGKDVTADQIVDRAIAANLNAIAITDHNSGAWIDCVKLAAKHKDLAVFPGVEISCHGGKRGIHLIALFDVDKDSEHVQHLLSTLDIPPARQGDIEALTNSDLGITAIIDIIQNSTWQGVAIPAHVTSSKGILEDIRGNPRTEVVQHPDLIAVDSRDFLNEELKDKKKRAVDLLDGSDPKYRRKLAVYQASDNPSGTEARGHGLAGIGSCCAYFKMEQVNLESLRQCFLDPDVRIVQDFEFSPEQYPRIEQVRISGGFLEEQTIQFNEGLNSIIGGKGTGKSLLVELMRFVLEQESDLCEIKEDHDHKLEYRLGQGNYVELDFLDRTGKVHSLKRTFEAGGGRNDDIPYDPAQILPVLFLSQNEIIKIAENKGEQLKFIDRFFNFKAFSHRIHSIQNELEQLDRQLRESILAVGTSASLEKEISTNEVKMSRLDEQLAHSLFAEYQVAQQKDQTIQTQKDKIESIREALQAAHEAIASIGDVAPPESLAHDPVIQDNNRMITRARDGVLSQLGSILTTAENFNSQMMGAQETWNVQFDRMRLSYNEHVRSEGGDYQQLAGQREKIAPQLDMLRAQLQDVKSKREQLSKIESDRESKLDELEEVYDEYRSARVERCKHFQVTSAGRLRLRIRGASNSDAFREQLLELKRGSRLLDSYIDEIVSNIMPRNFINLILQYLINVDSSPSESSAILATITSETKLDRDKIQRLVNFIVDSDKLEQMLHLQYEAQLEDRPEIKYNVGSNEFASLDTLSVGQKSTALLIIALSDEQMPVVIDQPEDSLDIQSIWEDICSKVRLNKAQRQFIFTTHNSNIAVASDSDSYIVLKANSENGWIVHSGSMDHTPVDEEVLMHMEGGTDPYRKKYRKYRADKRLSILSD